MVRRATGVPVSAEVLARVKRVGGNVAEGADELPFVAGQVGLGAIFNHPKLMLPRDGHDRVHIRRLTVKMHGNDADGSARNMSLDLRGIDRERLFIGVAKNDPRAGLRDRFRGGNPGVRGRDHFVARLDFQGTHRNVDGVRAIGA